MKIASGALSARRRGTRWPSVSVAQRCSSLGVKSSRRTKWSMTLCSCGSAIRPPSRAPTLRSSRASKCFSAAIAIADSQTFDHGSGDAANRAIASRPKILSPIGLSSRLPLRQADRLALALVEDALGLEEQRLAEALGADDDELVVAPRREEGVDLGRAVEQRLVEVLGHPDVVGIHGPRTHRHFPPGHWMATSIEPTPGERPAGASAGQSPHVRDPRRLVLLTLARIDVALRRTLWIAALAWGSAVAQRPAPDADGARLALPSVGLRARDIAVVVNDADPASVEVGRYYAAKRGIADDRVIHVRFPPGQAVMASADFMRVQAVLDAKVDAGVQAFALAWTLPYRVECMSVTAAFALGFDPAAVLRPGLPDDQALGLLQQPEPRAVHRPSACARRCCSPPATSRARSD